MNIKRINEHEGDKSTGIIAEEFYSEAAVSYIYSYTGGTEII